MQQPGRPQNDRSIVRIFSACLLTWLLIALPLAQVALASPRGGRAESRGADKKTQTTQVTSNVTANPHAAVPQPAPAPLFAPAIVATKDDGLPAATQVAPGGTIDYTVSISNNGVASPADDATSVQFTDQIDAHTTLVPGSPIAAGSDRYSTIGNVQISIPDGATDLLGNDFDPDTGNNTGMTATAETKSSTACTGGCSNNVTINANGSFTYNPPVGFTGTDTFTYTANSGTSAITTTVTINVANKIWFINNNTGACTSNCNGRLTHPFVSLAAFNLANLGGPGQPGDNDWIFVFESPINYVGPAVLRAGQKFIGQDVIGSLISLTGFTQPSGTDPIPVANSGNATIVNITSTGADNGITLNTNNLLRGFTVGNSGGPKIFGNAFGTLTVGNSVSPDVILNGTGQALNLTNGILAVTGGFLSVTTTSSSSQGINLSGVSDSGAGAFSFGPVTVSGSTAQGILIGTTTADLNFGATSVTNGTDGISLQNNSAGVKTFASITTSGQTGAGFLHGAGGGQVAVTGATSITNPAGNGIDIDSSNANLSFAGTTVNKNSTGNNGVESTNNAGRTISFSSLAVTTSTGFGILTTNGGTVNVTTGSLTQSGAGGGAASLTNTTLGMTFTTVSSNGGANGLLFSGGSGSFASTTTTLQNNAGIGLTMSSSGVAANFGNTSVTSSAGDAVDLSSNTGAITFGDLDLTPDANLRGLDAANNTGTITSTSGDIAATGAPALVIDGPAGRTPLAMVLTNVDSTNSTGEGVNLTDVSGSFAVNDPGTATSVVNSTGNGIVVSNSTATVNFGNTSVTNTGNANADDTGTGVFLTNNNGGVTFGSLTITPDANERGLLATDTDGASAAGTITTASGSITTSGERAIEITGAAAANRTPLAMVLTLVSTNGGSNGIILQSTSGTFTVNGTGTTDGSGGVIQSTTSSGVRIVDGPTTTLKNMNLTGNGTAQTVAGSAGTCGGDLRTGNNLSCVANLFLQNLTSVTLDNLNVINGGQMGINGNAISGFSLANSSVTGNGNEAFENGITFQNLSGTNSITNTIIKNNRTRQIHVGNITSGLSTTLNITGTRTNNAFPTQDTSTTMIGNDVAGGVNTQQGILLETFGGTNISPTLNITGVVFNNNSPQNAVDLQPLTSGSLGGTTTNSSFDTNAGGVIISAQNAGGGTYNITNSEFNRTALQSILYAAANPTTGTLQGTVSGNTIGTAGQSGSACFPVTGSNCVGIDANFIGGSGSIQLRIQSNTVQQFDGVGIRVVANGTASPDMNVNIVSNTVQNPLGLIAHGISTNIGTTAGANVDGCLGITGNTITGTFEDPGAGAQFGILTNVRFLSHHRLPGYAGSTTATGGPGNAVTDFIIANNTTSNKVFTQRGGSGDYPGGAACTTPLLLGPGGVDSFISESNAVASSFNPATLFGNVFVPTSDLQLVGTCAGDVTPVTANHALLTQQQLDEAVTAATSRWLATGLSARQIKAINELQFQVGDLRDRYLGEATGNRIVVDRDAQGKGWFIDATPSDDQEFQHRSSATRSYTSQLNVAAGRIDLLTALEHEIGHRLGLGDVYSEKSRNSIMYGYLTVGERRVPSRGEAAHAQPGSLVGVHHLTLGEAKAKRAESRTQKVRNHATRSATLAAPFAGETITANIGTLPAGGNVIIKFSVTVNNPPNLTLLNQPRVENQGTVTAAGGINVLTDDPSVAGANDKTVTLINLFDTTTTLVSDLDPSNFGDPVTFTATINETPVQGTADPAGTVDFIDMSDSNAVICDNVPVTGGTAQCQTSTLTAGTHNIRADYSGDGNFDPSQSNIVAQDVNACTASPIVTSTADGGAGSLREALANVCSGTTITFNIAGAGPHTITLTSGELVVGKNVTINNNSGESITVSGGGTSRVFNVSTGITAAIIGLTVSGGSASNGAGVLNNGTLTIVNSTLTGNTATSDGGGVGSAPTATALTLINTTVSGNNANGFGGGVDVLGGTATIINSTITNNHGNNDDTGGGGAGGLRNQGGTVTLHNTIVAGNFSGSGTGTRNDIEGALQATSSNNLIGDGSNMTGITNSVNGNQVGTSGSPIDPQLGPLASNGGTTQTHALLATSPAVETGSNAALPVDTFDLDGDTNMAETLPVDQRGTGFPRNADSADANTTQTVDIGAFELHPSIEDIPNQTTDEDTTKNVTFNLGDDTGSLIATVVATSSNTTLVPNANLSFTGSGGSRTLQIIPAANVSGTTTITVTVTATNGRTATDTFDLTVNAVNDPPSGTDNTVSTAEETPYTFTAADFGFTDPNDTPPNTFLAVKITTLPALGTLTNNNLAVNANDFISVADINAGLFKFTPAANSGGTPYTSFTFQVQDNGGGADLDPTPNTMTINVTAINDGPVNTVPGPQSTNEDTALVFSSGNSNQISVADADAGSNPVKITLTATNGTITLSTTAGLSFITGTGTNDATMMFTGTLTAVNTALNGMSFNPTANFNGAASLQIVSDDQGNTGTGGPLTDTDSVSITVNAVNDPPSGTDNTVSTGEDTPYTFTAADFGFTDPNDTPPNTLLAVKITTLPALGTLTNNNLAVNANDFIPVANINGGLLKFTPAANGSGTPYTSFTFQVQDNGGGTDLDPTPNTMTINVTAVNNGPVNTVPGPQSTNEDTALVFSSGNSNQISVADADAGSNPVKITLTATNGTITLSTIAGLSFITGTGTNDATMTFTGALTAVNTALNGMSFNPTADFNGPASLTITSDDQGNTGTGGPLTDTDTVNITVTAQNDAPVVTTSAGNTTYTENGAAVAIDTGITVTDGDSANLVSATVAITAGFDSTQDTLAFSNTANITGNYNSGTGVLTLTGSDTVANYQLALRSVTYSNSSDNPTTSRTVSFTVNDGTSNSNTATKGITINAVNDGPVNTVPGPQSTNQNTPLTFSSGGGNQISVADVDAGANTIQVTLTATNGTLTLSGTSGLSFSFTDANGTGTGDGTADATMTFRGTIANINSALNGMTFTPTAGFSGAATVTITSNDLGNTGSGGPLTDTDVVNIQVSNNISIQDAQVAEPDSGSINMVFTVVLSAPAPAGGVSVNFTTQDQLPAISHAVAGQDYTATSGTVNFAVGEQVKTINVPVLSDNKKNEVNETFLVVLSSPVNGTLVDGTATGTILIANQPGTIVISELRTSGPGGAGDDFVEVYNNSDSPHTVNGTNGGYGLFKMGADCNATPILIGVIPNGTVIPARGHYLFVGSAYSLGNYGGSGAAAGDSTMSSDIENDRNVAIFSTGSVATISSVNRLDAVGFGTNTGGVCDLLREGSTLTPLSGSVLEYSYARDECGKKGNPASFGPCPTNGFIADTNSNSDDLVFVETTGATTAAGQRLGAPGPQNMSSARLNLDIVALLLDATKGSPAPPNRVRDNSPVTNGAHGTMSIRRRFVNNTGAPVTRLRIRIVDISSLSSNGGVADLRVLTSSSVTVTGITDSGTCLASNGSASTPCTVTVLGTTLETPPNQPIGGALNSSLSAGTITLGTPLAPGASINLQLLLGIEHPGSFKFFFNIEALP